MIQYQIYIYIYIFNWALDRVTSMFMNILLCLSLTRLIVESKFELEFGSFVK